jgi:2-polyprenyl-3-methyl-5-hydroxy-6-metoxy-1,4-benzoquinol methylase
MLARGRGGLPIVQRVVDGRPDCRIRGMVRSRLSPLVCHSDRVSDAPTGVEVVAAWNELAPFWDERSGPDGSEIHRLLISPSVHRLLNVQPAERVLDVGSGNGVVARELARRGASVVASDASDAFIGLARRHSSDRDIDYRVVDATDEAALLQLGVEGFDAIVASMVLMDMPEIDPLFRAATSLLRPGGRFVFAVLHPCFNNPSTTWLIEESRDLSRQYALKISDYRDAVAPYRAAGEPAPHWFFHRSLATIVRAAQNAGLILDELDEPLFEPDAATSLWLQWQGLPPVLVGRLRRTDALRWPHR